jgi:hypothetical protein
MDILRWLQDLGKDADVSANGFQAKPMYIFMSVMLPVLMGLLAGYGLRLLERVFGIELGRRGGH